MNNSYRMYLAFEDVPKKRRHSKFQSGGISIKNIIIHQICEIYKYTYNSIIKKNPLSAYFVATKHDRAAAASMASGIPYPKVNEVSILTIFFWGLSIFLKQPVENASADLRLANKRLNYDTMIY